MTTTEYIQDQFNKVQQSGDSRPLSQLRQKAFDEFTLFGLPVKHEEWKYTRISSLFNNQYQFGSAAGAQQLSASDLNTYRLPGCESANELFFINGLYAPQHSRVISAGVTVLPLEEAAGNQFAEIVKKHAGHSSHYLKDGINALNTSFINAGVFIHVDKAHSASEPIFIYNITDARSNNMLSQPRALLYLAERSTLQVVETYVTIGKSESFTNQVLEAVVEKGARFEYYKIQNDASHTNQVSTTHIRQVGESFVHTVTISLNGNIVRNNQNMVMDAPHCEAHLYGLYFLQGKTHVDNHTIVDNVQPHCFSNELYKGIIDDEATGVFNGKIYVQRPAQKTNAYQSNKNVLLSENASVNTKPQLEIFADDVKCSHGCTIGKLDEEGMFYLRSRGISEEMARSLLLQAFSLDVLDQVKLPLVRDYIDGLLHDRLQFDMI